MTRHPLAGCFALIVALGLVEATANSQAPIKPDPSRVMAQFTPPVTAVDAAEQIVLLDRYFATEEITVDSGSSLRSLSLTRCGRSDAAWVNKVSDLNGLPAGRDRLGDATRLKVPPCAYWTGAVDVHLPPGVAPSTYLAGIAGLDGVNQLRELLKGDVLLSQALASDSWGYASIKLPYTTQFRPYVLKPEWQGKFSEVATAMKANGTGNVYRNGTLELVVAGGDIDCGAHAYGADWPFPAAQLAAVLKANAARRANPPRLARIAVADTGLQATESRLFLFAGREGTGKKDVDDDENGLVDDIWGGNMDGVAGFPQVLGGYLYASHGTHVAGLALGGLGHGDLNHLVKERISLTILNIVSRDSRAGDPPTTTYPIWTSNVSSALSYAAAEPVIPILNLSVETQSRDDGLRAALLRSASLVVIAAGNSKSDLDKQVSYPASFRSEIPDRVLSVAAHDPAGAPAPFTNFGKNSVDLAAPGCAIESTLPDSRRGVMSGTSQAAPLVSFTAGLLYAQGLSGPQIRRRILLTVDFDRPRWGNLVSSGGRLNIVNALRIYDDLVVVEEKGVKQVWAGSIEDACVDVDGECMSWTTLKRVVPQGNGTAVIWLQSPEGVLSHRDAPMKMAELKFRRLGAAQSETIPVARIADVIVATFR